MLLWCCHFLRCFLAISLRCWYELLSFRYSFDAMAAAAAAFAIDAMPILWCVTLRRCLLFRCALRYCARDYYYADMLFAVDAMSFAAAYWYCRFRCFDAIDVALFAMMLPFIILRGAIFDADYFAAIAAPLYFADADFSFSLFLHILPIDAAIDAFEFFAIYAATLSMMITLRYAIDFRSMPLPLTYAAWCHFRFDAALPCLHHWFRYYYAAIYYADYFISDADWLFFFLIFALMPKILFSYFCHKILICCWCLMPLLISFAPLIIFAMMFSIIAIFLSLPLMPCFDAICCFSLLRWLLPDYSMLSLPFAIISFSLMLSRLRLLIFADFWCHFSSLLTMIDIASSLMPWCIFFWCWASPDAPFLLMFYAPLCSHADAADWLMRHYAAFVIFFFLYLPRFVTLFLRRLRLFSMLITDFNADDFLLLSRHFIFASFFFFFHYFLRCCWWLLTLRYHYFRAMSDADW